MNLSKVLDVLFYNFSLYYRHVVKEMPLFTIITGYLEKNQTEKFIKTLYIYKELIKMSNE